MTYAFKCNNVVPSDEHLLRLLADRDDAGRDGLAEIKVARDDDQGSVDANNDNRRDGNDRADDDNAVDEFTDDPGGWGTQLLQQFTTNVLLHINKCVE